jgi:hypothetical protein
MIRTLCLALLAANLLFFGWSHWLEPGAPRATATPAPIAAVRTPPPAPPAPEPCTSLGPFPDVDSVTQAAAALGAAGRRLQSRTENGQAADGYWVFVAGSVDDDAQQKSLQALRKAGITDTFAMPDDPGHRVSVGIFTDRNHAEQRATRVRSLKLDARVEEHFRTDTRHWLDVHGAAAQAFTDDALKALGITTTELKVIACPS